MNGRVSVGLRVSVCLRRAMDGKVFCIVFACVLDSQKMVPSAAACRGRRPKNRSKRRRKRGEKSGSTASDTFLVARVVVFLLARPSVCLGPGFVAVCSFLVLGVGCRSRVPWPLPSSLAAALVFLVPAPVLVFVRKGDVPRTDPFVPLPVRASFRYTQALWRYCGVLLRLLCWRYWEVLWYFTPLPSYLVTRCVSPCTFYVIPTFSTVMNRTSVANLAIFQQR